MRSDRTRRASAGDEHDNGDEAGAHVIPTPTVETAGEPDDGTLRFEDLGPREQVLGDGSEHGGNTDPDQHQPVWRDPAPPGQDVDGQRGDERTTERTEGGDAGSRVEDDDAEHGGRTRASVDADDVRAGQRVAGERLEDRPRQTERHADQHAGQRTRQAQRADDEVGVVATEPEDGGDNVAERDGKSPTLMLTQNDDDQQPRQDGAHLTSADGERRRPR